MTWMDDWKLRSYQRTGAEFLSAPPEGYRGRILADPRGFGKTVQILAAIKLRKLAGFDGNVTPIITTAISRGDWRREIARVWPAAATAILCSDEPKYKRVDESVEQFEKRQLDTWIPVLRGEVPGAEHHFPIVSFESVPKLLQASMKHELVYDVLVVSEAHRLKKYSTRTSQSVRPLVGKSRVAMLDTGTPVHNRPHDLYNLLDTCKMGYAGHFTNWVNKITTPSCTCTC